MTAQASLGRYEIKLRVEQLDARQVCALIRLHPCLFRMPYPPRHVNNIYLDTPHLGNYYDHVNGAANRLKVRIRWYGELFGPIERPVLEFKIKRGLVGLKEQYPLMPFVLDQGLNRRYLQAVLRQSNLPAHVRLRLAGLQAVLVNRYYRRYFAAVDGRCRATLDTGMLFYGLAPLQNRFLHRHTDRRGLVVELKLQDGYERYADRVAGYFPFPVTKNSKYAQGVEAVCLG